MGPPTETPPLPVRALVYLRHDATMLRNLVTGVVQTLPSYRRPLAWSPNSRWLMFAGSYGGDFIVQELASGAEASHVHPSPAAGMAVSDRPDARRHDLPAVTVNGTTVLLPVSLTTGATGKAVPMTEPGSTRPVTSGPDPGDPGLTTVTALPGQGLVYRIKPMNADGDDLVAVCPATVTPTFWRTPTRLAARPRDTPEAIEHRQHHRADKARLAIPWNRGESG